MPQHILFQTSQSPKSRSLLTLFRFNPAETYIVTVEIGLAGVLRTPRSENLLQETHPVASTLALA